MIIINLMKGSIKDILENIIQRYILFFILMFFVSQGAFGQRTERENIETNSVLFSGHIVDSKGEPIIGASVIVDKSKTGTISDLSGKFSVKCPINSKILVSYIGYSTQTIELKEVKEYTITLKEATNELDELVIVGYGTSTKREVTSAISKIKDSDLNQVSNSSVSAALKGKTTGVRVYNTSGAPGTQSSITIRGGSSINKSNDALVLIDGMPGSLSSVNSQDVESIEILKDAASTAIYGSRASNGIILITTKNGKAGKITINANVSYGYQNASRRMDKLNAEEYINLVRPALARSPYSNLLSAVHPAGTGNTDNSSFSTRYLEAGETIPTGWKSLQDPIDPTKTLIFENNDLQDQVFQGGNILNAYMSLNGGSDKGKYMLSLGYIGDDGYTPNRTWNNFTLRSNSSYNLSKKISLTSNIAIVRAISNPYASESTIFSTGIHLAPTIRSIMPDGTIPPGKDASYRNPLYIIDNISNKRTDLKASAKLGLEWKILNELSAKLEGFYEGAFNHRNYFEKKNIYNSLRSAKYYGDINQTQQYDFSLNYNKTFNSNHKFSGVVGVSYLNYDLFGYSAQANGSSRDDLTTLNASSVYENASSDRERETLNSVFSRLSYNYKTKLLLSATLRADGSSKFASENRWGYFPGVSVGYILSEEDFIKSINWVSLIKLRTSYGLTGNNSVSRYAYQGVWSPSDSYLGAVGFAPSTMPNYGLTWEHTNQFDAGVEFGVLRNRINFVFDFYDKTTKDLLFSDKLPNTSGFGSLEKNIGTVKFWGYEFEINAKVINTKNLQWEFGTNISYNLNKVLKLPYNGNEFNRVSGLMYTANSNPTKSGVGGLAEGERLYAVIGYKVDHILDTDEEAANAMYDERAKGWDPVSKTYQTGRKIAGDYEWVDRDGNGRITPDDQYVLGYLVPTTTGGFNTTLKYKNWELYALFDYALGHVIYDRQVSLVNAGMQNGFLSPTTDVLSYWQKSGDAANTKYARFDVNDGDNNGQWNHYRTSNMNVYKGDYLSFREFKLSYSLSNSMIKALNIANMQIFFSGQNLYCFSAYPGYVTEYSGSARNLGDGNYPLPRIWNLGFNATF